MIYDDDDVQDISEATPITIDRLAAGFDRACESAYRLAESTFGITDDGNSTKLPAWERSCCWIEVKFVAYVRTGSEHTYTFTAVAKKLVEDE